MPHVIAPAQASLTDDDAIIAQALERASVPALLMSMIHITGDTSILTGSIRPQQATMGEFQGMISEDQKAQVRAHALEVLKEYRDRGCTLPPPPSAETIREMMSFAVGEEVPDNYVPMMREELALGGVDSRAVDSKIADAVKQEFHALIIGAGMSGLLAAIQLEDAGIPYTVIEKNDGIGGTWLENTYPGCRVDVGNHFYCYSFAPNHDWSEYYSQRRELNDYFERCGTQFGVWDRIRFRTEVVSARFYEEESKWQVQIQPLQGEPETLRANVVISAVGQLNRPKIPNLDGLASFRGPAFHSARWEGEHDLEGKRVAVIGTGASALQLVPEVARQAGQLFVFQRSPGWMLPNPDYHSRVSNEVKWLMKHVPYYARWYRFLIFWPGSDGLLPSLKIDPEWPHPARSVNAINDATRTGFIAYMKQQLGDDDELLEKVTPSYPPFGKRILQDNGSWLQTLRRDNVELVDSGVTRVTADSLVAENGEEYPVDVIIFATGFHANRFLWPMQVTGRDAANLREQWEDDPEAYLGISVPNFPNLFLLYGPNTNLAHAGSIIFHSECQVRYIMGCIHALLAGDHAAMECKRDVHDEYNARLQREAAQMVWAHPGMDSWYKNARGRITTTSPWRLVDYWAWTREPELNDYHLTPRGRAAPQSDSP
ncbi:MAG: NAD(P)/FAD-dependent oxidoreductase [Myxococcota bacterium]